LKEERKLRMWGQEYWMQKRQKMGQMRKGETGGKKDMAGLKIYHCF
jgi:hypothetical protein